jgi:hypothetical protein
MTVGPSIERSFRRIMPRRLSSSSCPIDRSFVRRVRERATKEPTGIASKVGAKNTREAVFVLILGLMLSLNSGYINGLCLSGMVGPDQQAVSAFTGTYTKSGLALAAGDPKLFGFEFTLILSFIGGALVSGAMNPEAVPHKLVPTYGPSKFDVHVLALCYFLHI